MLCQGRAAHRCRYCYGRPDDQPARHPQVTLSVKQRIAFGERAGQQVRRIGSGFGYEGELPALTGPHCASVNGFSLHANTQVPAYRRDQLERLIRYTARGAVALERLEEDAHGDIMGHDPYTVVFRLKQPYGPFRIALPIVSIVNPALIKAHEQNGDWAEAWLAQNEAGSGAYRLVKFDQASGFLIERFPECWRGWGVALAGAGSPGTSGRAARWHGGRARGRWKRLV